MHPEVCRLAAEGDEATVVGDRGSERAAVGAGAAVGFGLAADQPQVPARAEGDGRAGDPEQAEGKAYEDHACGAEAPVFAIPHPSSD